MAKIAPAVFDSPHFTFHSPTLQILSSDVEEPTEAPTSAPSGAAIFPRTGNQDRCEAMAQQWLLKLGKELVQDFMAVDMGLSAAAKKKKQYWLHDFPPGYTFYIKQRMGKAKKTKGRYDAYLIGNKMTFRSPKEFVCHAAWLMAGQPSFLNGYCCYCKYCMEKSKTPISQTDINKHIKNVIFEVRRRLQEARQAGEIIDRRVNAMNKQAYLKPIEGVIAGDSDSEVSDTGGDGSNIHSFQDDEMEVDELEDELISSGEKSMDEDDRNKDQVKDMVIKKIQKEYLKSKGKDIPPNFWGSQENLEEVALPNIFWNEDDDTKVQSLIKTSSALTPESAKAKYIDLPH